MMHRRLWWIPFALALSACGASVKVAYDHERCVVDGQPATLSEVEAAQSRIATHVVARQPFHTGVTVLIVLLAVAGYLDKVALILAARRSAAPRFAERVRAALERHRPHPVRYFGIVTSGLVLVGLAAGWYVYLDADKRASERSLQQLQFCHLALKGAAEQVALEEQRHNIDQLRSTAGSIKELVDSLPPAEQEKAEKLLWQVHISLGNQERMLERQNAVAAAVASGSAELQKGLGVVEASVNGLKGLPERMQEATEALARLDARTRLDESGKPGPASLGAALADQRQRIEELAARIQQVDCSKSRLASGRTVGEALSDLLARPPPVCRCESSATASSDPGPGRPHPAVAPIAPSPASPSRPEPPR